MYSTLEQLLLKACRRESHDEELATITERYSVDMQLEDTTTDLVY